MQYPSMRPAVIRSLPFDESLNLTFGLISGVIGLGAIVQAAYLTRWMIRRVQHEEVEEAQRNASIELQDHDSHSVEEASSTNSGLGIRDAAVATLYHGPGPWYP